MNLDVRKRNFIVLSFLLAMIFFYGASTPVLAAEPTVIEVKDKTEFEEAINQVNADSGNEYTIKLTADIQIGGASISPFCKATILGNGHTLTVGQNGSIHVEEGAQLTLGSEDGNRLDIRSVNAASNDEPGMLDVQGTCKMYQGVTLAGREGNNYFGGGVTVSGGEFHMYGGIIENCGIRGGSVCYGGGIASYGYYTNMHVTGCTITGNTAKVYGGGFAATENTRGGKTTITNTVLCNNLANQAGADVYLSNAPLELPAASDMDSLYLGEPEDVRGNKIDGWYVDGESLRYMDQVKEAREEYTGYANIQASSDRICLIAAVKSPQAKITFTNEDGSTIKESWYPLGTAAKDIELPEAFKASDETYDYIFEAWSSAIEDVTKNAVYTAKFRRVFKKVKVHYTFHGTSSGRELPAEVLALLPGDTTDYPRDARIEAIAPGKTEVQVEGGTWIFKGFDKDSVLATMENVDDAGAVKFSGYWEFVAKEESIITPDKDKTDEPSSKTEKTDAPSLKSEEKVMEESPRTGDDSRIFLWLSLLLASGIAGITTAFVYCRRE